MPKKAPTAAERAHMAYVASLPCLVCGGRSTCEHSMNLLGNWRPNGCSNTALGLTINRDRSATMAAKPIPSQDILRQLLTYDPETGFMFWTGWGPRTPMRVQGRRAFQSQTLAGYYRGGLLGRNVMAHRVVWKWHFGTEPDEIDHINGDKANNRIENLRAATRQENLRNTSLRHDNKTGVHGVYWHKGKRLWIAAIRTGGKQIHLGQFESLETAKYVRRIAEHDFGYHPNHGRFPHG